MLSPQAHASGHWRMHGPEQTEAKASCRDVHGDLVGRLITVIMKKNKETTIVFRVQGL